MYFAHKPHPLQSAAVSQSSPVALHPESVSETIKYFIISTHEYSTLELHLNILYKGWWQHNYAHTHTHIHTHTHTHTHTQSLTHMYIQMCMHTHICIYTHIGTHTHTHLHAFHIYILTKSTFIALDVCVCRSVCLHVYVLDCCKCRLLE